MSRECYCVDCVLGNPSAARRPRSEETMTTRRRLDQQPAPGHGDDACDNNAARASQPRRRTPEPAGASVVGRDRGSPASTAPTEPDNGAAPINGAGDDVREAGRVHAPITFDRKHPAGRDRERDDGELVPDRDAGGVVDTPEQRASSSPEQPARSATDDDIQAGSADRAGLDVRRRGWFWHWNNVVTQYAPLIGLKGVGLLNSYTVWTDRRDESPHRGYAFPSQQSEAGFYGEERAELITINKILVALDLIEIRKEMLTRTDERGRRWRVPHNLYRVKDRPDGVDLRAVDVMRVAILANQDETVFRYVRRVFSERFRPIDGDNVWHAILNELRHDPTWRELQERTRAIEARASARTRAGHQSRSSANAAKAQSTLAAETTPDTDAALDTPLSDAAVLPNMQQTGTNPMSGTTSVAGFNTGSQPLIETVVEPPNDGSTIDVAESNTGSASLLATIAAGSNDGRRPVVGPGNTTYDQPVLTTTTTTTSVMKSASARDEFDNASSGPPQSHAVPIPTDGLTDRQRFGRPAVARDVVQADPSSGTCSSGDRSEQPPASEPGASAISGGVDEGVDDDRDRGVVSGRTTTNEHLGDRFEGGSDEQRTAGTRAGSGAGERRLADPAGGGPVVDPGPLVISTFEAANDRRATPLELHLLAELERDAGPAARAVGSTGAGWVVAAMREAVSSGSSFVAPKRIREIIARWSTDPRNAPSSTPSLTSPSPDATPPAASSDGVIAEVRLPGGSSGSTVWAAALDDLSRVLDRGAYDRLLAGSRITRYWRGTVEICVASNAAADKLANEYRGLVERHLNNRLRRPVAVRFVFDPGEPVTGGAASDSIEQPASDTPHPIVIAEAEVEIGRQVWQSLLGDLARNVSPADLDRLAGVVVLGQDAAGAILLGTPSPLARRLLDGRYRADVEASLAALLGQPSPVRILASDDWSVAART